MTTSIHPNHVMPRLDTMSNERLTMNLSDTDMQKICRGNWRADVTDQNTNKRYRLRGASCGAPRCMCDAVIVKELP